MISAAFFTNATCSEQYISIAVFVPWNTCGVFIYGILGVNAFAYAPFAVLNYVVPLIGLIYAFTGWTIAKMDKTDQDQPNEETLKVES